MNPPATFREEHANHLSSFAVIAAYAGLNLLAVAYHEPWLDEAQAWLIARDASLTDLLALMNYEGTPALWHLILLPLAKAGLPYVWESLVHVSIATAAVTVFMLRAPFQRCTKILFVFSYYMAYEYSVVARSYSLGVLLMFLIAAMHEGRFRRPIRYALLVLLLSNANVFSTFVASTLIARFAYEICWTRQATGQRHLAYAGLLIMALGMALAMLQLIPAADNLHAPLFPRFAPMDIPRAVRSAFFADSGDKKTYELVAAIILATALLSILRRPGALFVVLWSYLGLFYVFVFKYSAVQRHHGLLFMVLMFGFWIARYESDVYWFGLRRQMERLYARVDFSGLAGGMIQFCLLIGVAFTLKMHYEDYRHPFSVSKDLARSLRDREPGRATIIAQCCNASAVLPYLPHTKLWYAGVRRYGTYNVWNTDYIQNWKPPVSDVLERAAEAFPDSDDLLFLLTDDIESPGARGLELLFQPDDSYWLTRDHCALYGPATVKTKSNVP